MDDNKFIPLSVIEDRLAEVESSIKDLEIERSVLEKLAKSAAEHNRPVGALRRLIMAHPSEILANGNTSHPATTQFHLATDKRPLTELAVDAVRELPGRPIGVVAKSIEQFVREDAKDRYRTAYNTLANLVTARKLRRDGDRIYLAELAQSEGAAK